MSELCNLHRLSRQDATAVLKALLDDIQLCPEGEEEKEETIHYWSRRCVERAAEAQLLSCFYPLLQAHPVWCNGQKKITTPIPLKTVWSWDWEALGEEYQSQFDVKTAVVIEASRPTAQLYRLSRQNTPPDIKEVERLVEEGAEVNWRPEKNGSPTLVLFGRQRPPQTEAILTCLRSERAMELSVGEDGETLLHQICFDVFPLEEATRILRAIVLHVETHPLDVIDVGEKWGPNDFIHFAAGFGRLSAFFPIVRELPYFGDHIRLLRFVGDDDWNALPPEDQACFSVQEIVEMEKY